MADARLTKAQMREVISGLSAENVRLKEEAAQAKADCTRYKLQAESARESASRVSDAIYRIRNQARAVKYWAEKYQSDKPVIVHAVDAVLFTPGYGEVPPFARWNYPGLELVK